MTRPLAILQIAHDYNGPFAHVCQQFTRACSEHHITTLYLAGPETADIKVTTGGDEVLFLDRDTPGLRGIKWGLLARVAQVFKKRHFDIVIAHRYKAIYVAGIMSYFFDIPLLLGVAHEHNVFTRPTRALFLSFWRKQIMMLAVSDSVARDVTHDCPTVRAGERLFTLHHAIDEAAEPGLLDAASARKQLKLSPGGYVFGAVGRLVAKKDFDLLLTAFAQLSEDCRLVLVGDGKEAGALVDRCRALGIAERVVFAGHVSNAARLFRAFDCFVFPSGEREAFGIVLLEAMLARVPVLSSDAPGPMEVLGETGFTFAQGDADALGCGLQKMYVLTSAERSAITQAAHERVIARFSHQAFKKRFWQLPPVAGLLANA